MEKPHIALQAAKKTPSFFTIILSSILFFLIPIITNPNHPIFFPFAQKKASGSPEAFLLSQLNESIHFLQDQNIFFFR